MNFATPGWVATFCLFVAFCAGGYFAYTTISERQRVADYHACVERISMSVRTATEYHQSVRICDYFRNTDKVLVGLYSSIPGESHRLAMVTRPIF